METMTCFIDRMVYIIIIFLYWVERRFWRSLRIIAWLDQISLSPQCFPTSLIVPNRLIFIKEVNNV